MGPSRGGRGRGGLAARGFAAAGIARHAGQQRKGVDETQG